VSRNSLLGVTAPQRSLGVRAAARVPEMAARDRKRMFGYMSGDDMRES
jgi:hypothetical protein